jgi:methylthioribose-1-phosphate isomerase
MLVVAPALMAMATYGLVLPSPAEAQVSCGRRVHEYCNANWQDFYSSRDECLEVELANCGTALYEQDDLAPAVREG